MCLYGFGCYRSPYVVIEGGGILVWGWLTTYASNDFGSLLCNL